MTTERERAYQKRYRAAHADELRDYKRYWSATQRRLNTPYWERQKAYQRAYMRRQKEAMRARSTAQSDRPTP